MEEDREQDIKVNTQATSSQQLLKLLRTLAQGHSSPPLLDWRLEWWQACREAHEAVTTVTCRYSLCAGSEHAALVAPSRLRNSGPRNELQQWFGCNIQRPENMEADFGEEDY
ncbi:uncharacterized protein LOC144334852 [Macaca mulatta]